MPNKDVMINRKDSLDMYPTDQERIKNVKGTNAKTTLQSEGPAHALFTNFDETAKLASFRFYQDVLGLQFTKESLVPNSEYGEAPKPKTEETPTEEAENSFF